MIAANDIVVQREDSTSRNKRPRIRRALTSTLMLISLLGVGLILLVSLISWSYADTDVVAPSIAPITLNLPHGGQQAPNYISFATSNAEVALPVEFYANNLTETLQLTDQTDRGVVQLGSYPGEHGRMVLVGRSARLGQLRHLAVNDQIEVTNRPPLNGSGRGRGYIYSIVSCNPPQTYQCLPTAEFIGQIEDGSGNSTGQTDDLLLIALPDSASKASTSASISDRLTASYILKATRTENR